MMDSALQGIYSRGLDDTNINNATYKYVVQRDWLASFAFNSRAAFFCKTSLSMQAQVNSHYSPALSAASSLTNLEFRRLTHPPSR
jgi:hypothetical protein